MFRNSGTKIKKFIERYFANVLIFSIVLGISGIAVLIINIDYPQAWIGVVMIVGALLTVLNTYLLCLFVHAFGDMVENTHRLREHFCPETSTTVVEQKKTEKRGNEEKLADDTNTYASGAKIKCSYCGEVQPAENTSCIECGKAFQ